MKERAAFVAPPAFLVVLSLGTSVFLVPDEREMALMHYKAKQFELARDLYQKLEHEGDLSVAVVKPLSELHLQFGDVDKAVALLERFVESHPTSVDALRKLGVFYQYAQRPQDYRRNLEMLSELELSEQALRELAHIYSAEARVDEQIEVLTLLTRRFPDSPQDFVDLTYLEARQGRPGAALDALEQLAEIHPASIDEQIKELELNLLLDTGEPERAHQQAARYLENAFSLQTLSRFVSLLDYKGEPQRALELMRPYETQVTAHAPLIGQYAYLLVTNGESDEAFDSLREHALRGRLPPQARSLFVELSLARGDTELAFETLEAQDLGATPDWLLEGLVAASIAATEERFARELLSRLSREFFDAHPLTAAELYEADGRRAGAGMWAERALEQPGAPADRLRLAYLFERLETPERSVAVLESLERRSGLSPDARVSLARLYVQLGLAAPALERFRRYRDDDPLSAAAWARLEATAGDAATVADWLRSPSMAGPSNVALLTELFFIAEARRHAPLALDAAERLYDVTAQARTSRLYLVRALTASGRHTKALEHARALLPGSPDENAAYHDALSAAWQDGSAEREELSRFLLAKLEDTALTDRERRDLVSELVAIRDTSQALELLTQWTRNDPDTWIDIYTETAVAAGAVGTMVPFLEALLSEGKLAREGRETATHVFVEHGSGARTLPYLRELAQSVGKHWVYLYDTGLVRANRSEELEAFWTRRSERTDLEPDDRRAAGYRLVELGRSAEAARAFFELAKDALGSSPDVSEYLFLASEAGDQTALPWVAERAAAARGEDKATWMRHLIFMQDPREAVRLVAETPIEEMPTEVRDAYTEALAAVRDVAGLSRVVDWSLRREKDPARLRRLGRLAFEGDALGAADRVFGAVLRVAPDDRKAQRELGLIAFMRSDYERAGRFLRRFLSSGPSDHESEYYYGEVLLRYGKAGPARYHYSNALALIDDLADPGITERAVRAQLLHRLDRSDEAFVEFERLIDERPDDAHLLADYVAARLERDDFEQARSALSRAERTKGPGRLRLDLLDANLLVRTRREALAVDKLEALRDAYPANASVVAALASAKAATGRWRQALAGFDTAVALDPNNQEFQRARESTWNLGAPELGGDWSQRRVGDEQFQNLVTLKAYHRFSPSLRVGFALEQSHARTTIPFANGARRSVAATRHHGELSARIDTRSGLWYRGSVHVLDGGAGASFSLSRPGAARSTDFSVDYRVPYWDIMYGAIDDARRDRIQFGHNQLFGRRLHAVGSVSAHRYGSFGISGLAHSLAGSGALTYTARLGNPRISFQYLFDAEYFQNIDRRHTPDGRPLTSVFLTSREVHAPGAIVSGAFLKHFRADGFGGYSWDRLGGSSPYFGFRLHYDLPRGLLARAFYERRLYRLDTARAESHWGAELFWRF